MRVFHDLAELPEFTNAVLTIGSFDGVHSGHQKILEQVNQLARQIDGESIVITFHPHPRLIIYPNDKELRLLTTIEEKIQLFRQYGVDNVVVVPFTVEFSQLSADEYIQRFLVETFHPKYVVIGYDHRFGLNRQGDINYLKWHAKGHGFAVQEIPKQEVEDIAVSSTKIRRALEEGDVAQAARWLNHPFILTGTVIKGEQLGTKLGYPTANLDLKSIHKQIPADGVYAVIATHKDQQFQGMLYIGNRPTLPHLPQKSIEVNLFNFDLDIYGDKLRLDLIARLRGDLTFDNLEKLTRQLERDKAETLQILSQSAAPEQQINKAPQARVAIVLLNYNTQNLLADLLPAVLETQYENLEIIVIDNGSTDGSAGFLQARFPKIRCIELNKNHGFAGGYNLGLQDVEAEYLVLLNTDVRVEPDWLETLIPVLEKDPTIGAAMPKILDFNNPEYFEYAGAAGGWMDYLGYPFCRGRIFDTVEKDEGQYNQPQDIFWASGAAFVIRKTLFEKLSGFDASFFAHLEEIDLCWRIKRAGFKIVAIPQSRVYHIGGGTLNYESSQKTYLNFRNSLFTLIKNESRRKLIWLIPLRLALDGVAALQFLFQGKTQHIGAILRAHVQFYKNFGVYWKKRKVESDQIARISIGSEMNRSGIFAGSIVWQYFIRRRKQFKNLP
ncbi:MAG: bifunctional riboflavin kinase/FAD synthetase [Saprospiraceae bacterium]|nr:bifunctional riboflavin kinase/FAD synthetase [Saprospiraceae bacterium]